jgi:hypothetical protein
MTKAQNAFLDLSDNLWMFGDDVINAFHINEPAEMAFIQSAPMVEDSALNDCHQDNEVDFDFGLGTALFLIGLVGLTLWVYNRFKKTK